MRIGILGPLEVVLDGGPAEVGGARLRALLTLLAWDAGRVVPAERLIGDLWEDRPPAAAANALQSLVSRLRTAVGRDLVESRASGYRLRVPREAVDAHDFEARVVRARAVRDPAERTARLREALELWRGPALAEVAHLPFAEGAIVRLEGLRRAALEERIEADLALGRHTEVIPELEALTAADPLREPLRGRLMRALYADGRQADALAVYEDTKRALAESLGVDPSPELERIYLAVLRHDPSLRAPQTEVAPAWRGNGSVHSDGAQPVREPVEEPAAEETPPNNLRARLTSFIGRDEDVRRVGKLLAESRLVTLTGPGGAGKTRLSVESAERLLDRLPDGVWLVELAPVTDPAEVPRAVLSVLGMREYALVVARAESREAADPLDRLADALGDRRLLILLDNCEHLLDATARLADVLLARCPNVRILATSREPLGITGESLWPVEPLALPPADASPEDAVGYPAVRLLADRAAAARPGFEVTGDNVAPIVRICRALDGMPLAIELAAARLRALTVEQLADRLADRFRLLTAGSRTAMPRHRTLQAVVEWSWDLLDGAERALWRRLSVFAGGATLEAAEAVCAGPQVPAADVFGLLLALVDKSLVIPSGAGPDGTPRFVLLETIKAYGLERLAEAGEEERVRHAHAQYFLTLAETAEPRLREHGQAEWLRRLTVDHDNLNGALRWLTGSGRADLAVRMSAALSWYWWLRGRSSEGGAAVAEVLRMPGLPRDQPAAVTAASGALAAMGGVRDPEEVKGWLRLAGEIVAGLGDEARHPILRLMMPVAEMALGGMTERNLAEVEPLFDDPDPWVVAMARFVHGQIALNVGRVDLPDADFAAALADFREVGDRWGTSFALVSQGELCAWRGRHEQAVALFQEALRLIDELGIVEETVWHIDARLANELALLGRQEEAERRLTAAMRKAERGGSPEMMAALHQQFGEFARRAGDHARAERLFLRAETYANSSGAGPPQFKAMTAASRGLLAGAAGDLEAAREHHRRSLELAVSSWDCPIVGLALVGWADLAEREGDPERAAELLGMAEGVRGMPDRSIPDPARLEASLRASLGDQAYEAAHRRGRAMSYDDVLARFGIERPTVTTLLG